MEIKNTKTNQRKKFKNLRRQSSFEERYKVKLNVENFLKNLFLNNTLKGYVGLYWPINNEVDLRDLRMKYPIALPKCFATKKLKFFAWDDSPLKNDCEGIPSPDNNLFLDHKEISVIFIPCLSIDRRFNRLGYGGGYFDKLRANKNWRKIPSIGVLTANCVSEELLISTKLDIPLSGYITDKEIVL
tara:strand:+ start:505 stop:1062 length:558 start_codon:yes stop_codon:yes gene_type:complete